MPDETRSRLALVRPVAIDYHVIVIANVVTWLALLAQTVSACGAGFAVCITRQGEVRLEVAGVPCDSCAHELDEADDHHCCATEEACQPAEPANAWTHACECLHVDLADPGMVPLVTNAADSADQQFGYVDALPAPHELIPADFATANRCHDPPDPHHVTSHLAMIHSVMLRC